MGSQIAEDVPGMEIEHADLVCKLVAESGKRNAEILLLPEYGLSSTSRDLVSRSCHRQKRSLAWWYAVCPRAPTITDTSSTTRS